MIKNLLSVLIATSVAISPLTATAADTFFYRYTPGTFSASDGGSSPGNPTDPTDPTGPIDPTDPSGDDELALRTLSAHYTTIVGDDFSTVVPGSDSRMIRWAAEQGNLPSGLTFNEDTGRIEGVADGVEETQLVVSGFNDADSELVRATVKITVIEPEGLKRRANYYAHTGMPFEGKLPVFSDVDVVEWKSTTALPDGIALNADSGELEGVATKTGNQSILIVGYDLESRAVATVYGNFLVEGGPIVERISSQEIDLSLNETFNVVPIVKNPLGSISYRLVEVDEDPAGITFDEDTGHIGGAFVEYGIRSRFRVEARDNADGSTGLSNIFTLSTAPAIFDIAGLSNQYGSVGIPFSLDLTSKLVTNSSEEVSWSVEGGGLPDGLSIDSKRGTISGTPLKVQDILDVRIRARTSSETDLSPTFRFRIVAEKLVVEGSKNYPATRTPFTTLPLKVISGNATGLTYKANPLPGITFDPTIGVFSSEGLTKSGNFDHSVTVTNSLGEKAWATVHIHSRLKPSPKYAETSSVERLKDIGLASNTPGGGIVGSPVYSVTRGELPSFAVLSPNTGFILIKPRDISSVGTYGPLVVTMNDDSGNSYPSNPFSFTVKDRPALVVSEKSSTIPAYISSYTRPFTVTGMKGTPKYELIDGAAQLPEKLEWSERYGAFIGRANLSPGTILSGFKVRITDGLGGSGEYGPFSMTIAAPEGLRGLAGTFNKTFSWSPNHPFTGFALARPGNAYGPLVYTLGQDAPVGLSIVDGVLAGQIADAGTYIFTYTVSDDAGRSATGTVTLKIAPRLSLRIEPQVWKRGVDARTAIVPQNGVAPYTITYDTASLLPPGVTYSVASRIIYGRPRLEGDYQVRFLVKDKTGDIADSGFVPFKVETGPQFSFTYPELNLTKNAYQFIRPTIVGGSGSYSFKVEAGSLPTGVGLYQTTNAGALTTTPRVTGIFPVTITGTDRGYGSTYSQNVVFNIAPPGTVSMTVQSPTVRTDTNIVVAAPKVANAQGTVTFSATGLMDTGLSIDPATGVVSGRPTSPGLISAIITATDSLNRVATASMKITVVEALAVSMQDGDLYYGKTVAQAGIIQPSATGVIGNATWKINNPGNLPTGVTFNATAVRFEGTPTILGGYGPVTLTVTDSQGSATSEPIYFTVFMNSDPIVLNVSGATSKIGFTVSNPAPTYSNTISGTRFIAKNLSGIDFSLNQTTGVLTGSFSSVAKHNIDLTITDDTGRETTKPVVFDILPRMTLSVAQLASVPVGKAISPIGVTRANAYGSSVWNPVTTGLPPGITFNTSSGQFVGTPTSPGIYGPITVSSRDSLNDTATSNGITFDVKDGLKTVFGPVGGNTLSLQSISVTKAADFYIRLINSGDSSAFTDGATWQIASGELPPGLSATPSGDGSTMHISGFTTDVAVKSYPLTWRIEAANGEVLTTAVHTFNVTARTALAISAGSSLNGVALRPISRLVTARNTAYGAPIPNDGWTVAGLPKGITAVADESGLLISGAAENMLPTTTITVTARDAAGSTATGTFDLTIAAPIRAINNNTSFDIARYTGTFQNSAIVLAWEQGSSTYWTGPLTYSVETGSLPPGLSPIPHPTSPGRMAITGYTGATGTYKASFRVTMPNGDYAITGGQISFNIAAREAPTYKATNMPTTMTVGQAISGTIEPLKMAYNEPTPASRWTVTGLPPGITWSVTNGILSTGGAPTTPGTYAVTIKATDSVGASTTYTTNWRVN